MCHKFLFLSFLSLLTKSSSYNYEPTREVTYGGHCYSLKITDIIFIEDIKIVKFFKTMNDGPHIAYQGTSEGTSSPLAWLSYNIDANEYYSSNISRVWVDGNISDVAAIEHDDRYYLFVGVNSPDVPFHYVVAPGLAAEESSSDINDADDYLSKGLIIRQQSVGGISDRSFFVLRQTLHGDSFGSVWTFQLPATSSFQPAAIFSILNKDENRIEIYTFETSENEDSENVQHFQTIYVENPPHVKTINLYGGTTVLVFSARKSSSPEGPIDMNDEMRIWEHRKEDKIFYQSDIIRVANVVDVDTYFEPQGKALMAVVSGNVSHTDDIHTVQPGHVEIYSFSTAQNKFQLSQVMEEPNSIRAQFLHDLKSNQLFLVILTDMYGDNVHVYNYVELKSQWIKLISFTSTDSSLIQTASFKWKDRVRTQIILGNSAELDILTLKVGRRNAEKDGQDFKVEVRSGQCKYDH